MFDKLLEPIRKGNADRREKYGKSDTFYESYVKAQLYRKWHKENLMPKMNRMTLEEETNFLEKFEYWDGWTGSRFEITPNPKPTDRTVHASTCRSNPVTGGWKAL